MATVLYTAQAHVDGGRVDGHGGTSDGGVVVDFRSPTEMGGDGGGTNPEQLFALGYASCFSSSLARVARRENVDPGQISIDSKVMLITAEGGGFMLGVTLDVALTGVADADAAADLVRTAHRVCPYSNATRGNIDVALTANGQAV